MKEVSFILKSASSGGNDSFVTRSIALSIRPRPPPYICVGAEGPWASVRQADESCSSCVLQSRSRATQHVLKELCNTLQRQQKCFQMSWKENYCAAQEFNYKKDKTSFFSFFLSFFFLNNEHKLTIVKREQFLSAANM